MPGRIHVIAILLPTIAVFVTLIAVTTAQGQTPEPINTPTPETTPPTGKLVVVPGLLEVGQTTLAVGFHVVPRDVEVEIEFSAHFTRDGKACDGSPGATPSVVAPTWVTLKACTAGDAYVRLVESETRNTLKEVSVTVAAAGVGTLQGFNMQAVIGMTVNGVNASELVPGGTGDDFSVDITGLDASTTYDLYVVPLNDPTALAFNSSCSNHQISDTITGASSFTKDSVVYGCLAPGSILWSYLKVNGVVQASSSIYGPMVNVADPTVSFASSSYSVDEESGINIGVNLSHGSLLNLTIPVTVSGTVDSSYYTVTGLPLTFDAEDISESFRIDTLQDADTVDDTLDLSFGSLPSGVSAGSLSTATVTIIEPPLPTPPAPTGLSATAAGPWSVDLSWTSVSGVAHHRVKHSLSGSGPWTTVSSDVTATTYPVMGLSPNTTYFFTVSAYGDGTTYAAEWSSESVQYSEVTPPLPIPDMPTGLSSTTGARRLP